MIHLSPPANLSTGHVAGCTAVEQLTRLGTARSIIEQNVNMLMHFRVGLRAIDQDMKGYKPEYEEWRVQLELTPP